MNDLKLMLLHTDTLMHNQGYSLPWLILTPSSIQQSLTPLLVMCRSPFSWAIPKSFHFVQWNNLQNYLTHCKQLRFDTVQCRRVRELGTSHYSNELKTNMNEKTKGILEPVKMLGFHTKALKLPHVQTLSATSAYDPAVCGSPWLSQ